MLPLRQIKFQRQMRSKKGQDIRAMVMMMTMLIGMMVECETMCIY